MAKLTTIEGIGPALATKLKQAGVGSTVSLLKYCCDRKGRSEIAKNSGIAEKQLLKFVNHADLMRIKGIGGEYSELLEAAGVDSVPELARRDPGALHAKMIETNQRKALVRQVPSAKILRSWVGSAKQLKKMVSH